MYIYMCKLLVGYEKVWYELSLMILSSNGFIAFFGLQMCYKTLQGLKISGLNSSSSSE